MNIRKRKADSTEFSFDNAFNRAINAEMETEQREPCFRLSSSPFCPIKTLMEWQSFMTATPIWTFKGDFYCGIGTAVHRALQSWIPKANPGLVLGHWRCRECCKYPLAEECVKCKQKCKIYKEALVGPQYCPKCGKPMSYEEFQYLLPKVPASGHSDGILLFDPKTVLGISSDLDDSHVKIINDLLHEEDSGYEFPAYVLEYKTTTKARVMNMTEPIPHHRAQASMYVGACREILEKKYGLHSLKMKGTIIKYVSRDTPDLRSRDFLIEVKSNDYYKYNKRMIYRTVRAYIENKPKAFILKELPCDNDSPYFQYYKDCEYRDVCEEVRKDKKQIAAIVRDSRDRFLQAVDDFEKKFHHKIKRQ